MSLLFNWRIWLVVGLAVGLAFTHVKAFKGGKAAVMAEWNADKVVQSETARLREKALAFSNQGVDRDLQTAKKRAAADAVLAAGKLRDLQTALGPGADTAPTSGTDDPRDAIINQCATSLVILDGDFKSLAAKASGLQGYAASVCVGANK